MTEHFHQFLSILVMELEDFSFMKTLLLKISEITQQIELLKKIEKFCLIEI